MTEVTMNIGSRAISTYQRRGTSSEWIVCIHGLQSQKDVFRSLLERDFFHSYSVLAIDCIGFGNSEKPNDFSYDLQDQAKICLAVLDALGIRQCHLIGHSMGGMIGILLLPLLQGRVRSIINMEGNLTLADCGESLRVASMPAQEFDHTGYQEFLDKLSASSDSSASFRLQSLQKVPSHIFYRTSVSIVHWSRSEILIPLFQKSICRKAFLYGSYNSQKILRVPSGIALLKVENAGHFMMLDQPHATHQLIESFLKNPEA